jgi:hypothetical protein
MIETVLTEVLGELREVKQRHGEQAGALSILAEKVQDFESKLSNIKISPPHVNTTELEMSIAEGSTK